MVAPGPLRRALALVAVLVTLLAASPGGAHPARASAVLLDLREASIQAELQLPMDQLGLAFGLPADAPPEAVLAVVEPQLAAYMAAHFGAAAPEGRAYSTTVDSVSSTVIDGAAHLVAQVTLAAPEGAATSALTLRDDVILHRVVSHKIFVSIRRDFRTATLGDRPELAGVMRLQRETLAIDRTHGSWWRGLGAVLVLGARHIAEGTDHLLFLLVLLLPAPLLARGGRWRAGGGVKRSAREVLKIVTAFTAGHSVTLVCAATGVLRVPGGPVEILVAGSILVSAVHALRPTFAGKEPFLAGGFGLIHGLAFATTLADLGLDGRALVLGLLGFNLGIEAMQLLVVALVMPWLVWWSRSPVYPRIRVTGAVLSAVAACGWAGERALGWKNPVAPAVDWVFSRGPHLIAIAALLTLAAALRLPARAAEALRRLAGRASRQPS